MSGLQVDHGCGGRETALSGAVDRNMAATTEQARVPEITSAFGYLDSRVALIDDLASQLYSRINGLMRQPDPKPETGKRQEAETSFGEEIMALTARLENTIETCRDMLDRLEI